MKRLQPILNLPQNQILHLYRSEPAVLRLQRASFLNIVSRPVTRLPKQSTQEDAVSSESSGSHLEVTEEKDAAVALLRRKPMSEHFRWTILHRSGLRGGNGKTDKRTKQCLSEGGKRGFRATCALADLHAQRAAHNLVMGQWGISNPGQKLGTLDGQGWKG
jgi:hypothetical protein